VTDDQARGRRGSPKVVLWAVLAVVAVILIVQNSNDTRVDVFFWHVTVGLWILLLGVFLLGLLLGWLLPKFGRDDGG
jgi:uncharacterized integral membrane protein